MRGVTVELPEAAAKRLTELEAAKWAAAPHQPMAQWLRRARLYSSSPLPPSPPAEKATAPISHCGA